MSPEPPESLCGCCEGKELRETELKTVWKSTCRYFCPLQVQLASVQAANTSHLIDQNFLPEDTRQASASRWEVRVFAGADAAGNAVTGLIKTHKNEIEGVNTQLALCAGVSLPLYCIAMEMRLTLLQDWKILGNWESLGDFLLTFFLNSCFRKWQMLKL